jgi:hypothetical protein
MRLDYHLSVIDKGTGLMSSKASAKRPPRGKKRGEPPKKRRPRGQGPFSLTVPAAGAMIGLSRTAAYRAVHAGQIPAIEVNGGFVVPKLPWLRMLGIPDTQPPAEEKTEIA